MALLLFVGLVIANWRVSRLLVKDEFPPVLALRIWVFKTWAAVNEERQVIGGKRWGILGYSIAYVFTCMWCMSFWVGLVLWGLADWRLSVPFPWLAIAAGSGLSGIMALVEARLDAPEPES